jgi:hypothetical protein
MRKLSLFILGTILLCNFIFSQNIKYSSTIELNIRNVNDFSYMAKEIASKKSMKVIGCDCKITEWAITNIRKPKEAKTIYGTGADLSTDQVAEFVKMKAGDEIIIYIQFSGGLKAKKLTQRITIK